MTVEEVIIMGLLGLLGAFAVWGGNGEQTGGWSVGVAVRLERGEEEAQLVVVVGRHAGGEDWWCCGSGVRVGVGCGWWMVWCTVRLFFLLKCKYLNECAAHFHWSRKGQCKMWPDYVFMYIEQLGMHLRRYVSLVHATKGSIHCI
jgi:hypothetical protein